MAFDLLPDPKPGLTLTEKCLGQITVINKSKLEQAKSCACSGINPSVPGNNTDISMCPI